MKWMLKMALREARYTRFRGLAMLFSMVFGLTVLVSFSSIKQGFHENFYEIATILTGGDLRVEVIGEPTERLRRLLPKLGDSREAYWGTDVQIKKNDHMLDGTIWFVKKNPELLFEFINIAKVELPTEFPLDIYCTEEQYDIIGAIGDAEIVFESKTISVDETWLPGDPNNLPVWIKRIQDRPLDRLVGNSALFDQLVSASDIKWKRVWVYHFEGETVVERISRANYILGYLTEEKQGVRFISELPDETGFYHSFELISNTLFLAAFSALILGTLAYTATFIDFSKGKTNTIALMRCLGCSMSESWGIYGVQIIVYTFLSVILAGFFSVCVQFLFPWFISQWSGLDMNTQIYWQALILSLGFGGCFILLPGLIAIMQLINCEPIEVLRSVKMPARRVEVRWIQGILISITVFLAIVFCFQMVENKVHSFIYLLLSVSVFLLLLSGVLGLRKLTKKLVSYIRSYPITQASANLYRTENQYVFTLSSITFGLFLITFLLLFFEGFARKGIHEIAGYGSIVDERVIQYLEWLQHVFFINQWMGVTLLMVGVMAVFVLLTSQRRTRLYESVVLEILGADSEMVRKIMIAESILSGIITAVLGIFGGVLFSAIVLIGVLKIPFVIPWFALILLFIGNVGVMVGMGFLNLKGILGAPPLTILRRRRHFSNW